MLVPCLKSKDKDRERSGEWCSRPPHLHHHLLLLSLLPSCPPQGDRMFSAVISKQSWWPADRLAPAQPGHTDNARPSVMRFAFTEVS